MTNFIERLKELKSFEDGWDDCEAKKPTTNAIQTAENFCAEFFDFYIFAEMDGGITIEFTKDGCENTVEINSLGKIEHYYTITMENE